MNFLHNIYQNLDPTTSAIDQAIATGGLVMIKKTQKAFWEGNKAGESWSSHRKPWELVWHLAKGTRLATSVDQSDLYDNIYLPFVRPRHYRSVHRWPLGCLLKKRNSAAESEA